MHLLTAGGAAFAAAIGSALILTLVDLYLTGHSRPALNRDWISFPSLGIEMSRAAVVMYVVALAVGMGVWVELRRRG